MPRTTSVLSSGRSGRFTGGAVWLAGLFSFVEVGDDGIGPGPIMSWVENVSRGYWFDEWKYFW